MPEFVTGLLKSYEVAGRTCNVEGNPVAFYYMRMQNGRPRLRDLLDRLLNLIIPYCLPRELKVKPDGTNAFARWKEARDLFNAPSVPARSGEFGELMVFFLTEGVLGAPQILTKMSLKTTPDENVKGSDGVYLGLFEGKLAFFYGESKVHRAVRSAIDDALESVNRFHTEAIRDTKTRHEFEIGLVKNHLDVPPGQLRETVLDLLDPWRAAKDEYECVNICFIGYDWAELAKTITETSKEWNEALHDLADQILNRLEDRFASSPDLKKFHWHFFFLPFESVDAARTEFLKGLGVA